MLKIALFEARNLRGFSAHKVIVVRGGEGGASNNSFNDVHADSTFQCLIVSINFLTPERLELDL